MPRPPLILRVYGRERLLAVYAYEEERGIRMLRKIAWTPPQTLTK